MPQFIASAATLTQVGGVPQTINAVAQPPHEPPVHTIPAAHAWPHDPQLAASTEGSTHATPHIIRGLEHGPATSLATSAATSVAMSGAVSLALSVALSPPTTASMVPSAAPSGWVTVVPLHAVTRARAETIASTVALRIQPLYHTPLMGSARRTGTQSVCVCLIQSRSWSLRTPCTSTTGNSSRLRVIAVHHTNRGARLVDAVGASARGVRGAGLTSQTSAFSTAARNSGAPGSTFGEKRAAIVPSFAMRNFSKFQVSSPAGFDCSVSHV